MTGRRILTVLVLSLAVLTVSACGSNNLQNSKSSATPTPGSETIQASQEPTGTEPAPPTQTETRVIEQKNEELPSAEFLSTYPGVLESMSLTLEQIIKVLGSDFQIDENKSQGYDIYRFSKYNLVLEYDTISESISSIEVNDEAYYVYYGAIKSADIDNDGRMEEIAAYQDQTLNGRVVVFGEDGLIKAEQATGYLGGKCDISLINNYGSDKENLIILNTGSEQGGDVFSYKKGILASLIPPGEEDATKGAEAGLNSSGVLLVIPGKGISYDCPMPDWLIKSYPGQNTPLEYRFTKDIKPVLQDQSISLFIRYSLQVKYYDNSIDGGTETYLDAAQVTDEYKYGSNGQWQLLSTKGGPKYDKANLVSGISAEDLAVGKIKLLSPVKDSAADIGLDLSKYTDDDLLSGVLWKSDNIVTGITNKQISYISLEKGSSVATARGLKVGDAKQKALDLYGLPDKGYSEDQVWTYYYMRRDSAEENGYLSADTFNIEFEGDIVSKIWMSVYIPNF